MWKIITLLTFLFLFIHTLLPNFSALQFHFLHDFCLRLNPSENDFRDLYAGLVCGHQPPPSLFMTQLRTSGLYHLIVVSGAHLVFLEKILSQPTQKLPTRAQNWIVFLGLCLYTLITQMAPPVTRALVSYQLHRLNEEQKLFWHGWHVSLAAGLLTLISTPHWLLSWSMLLSWAAALLTSQYPNWSWRQAVMFYLLLFPLLMGFAAPHPAAIFFNFFLGPVLGVVLFPLSILCFFMPPLVSIADLVWQGIFWLHQNFLPLPPQELQSAMPPKGALFCGWLYVIGLQSYFFFQQQKIRRGALCKTNNC
jgi:hypothetical protein